MRWPKPSSAQRAARASPTQPKSSETRLGVTARYALRQRIVTSWPSRAQRSATALPMPPVAPAKTSLSAAAGAAQSSETTTRRSDGIAPDGAATARRRHGDGAATAQRGGADGTARRSTARRRGEGAARNCDGAERRRSDGAVTARTARCSTDLRTATCGAGELGCRSRDLCARPRTRPSWSTRRRYVASLDAIAASEQINLECGEAQAQRQIFQITLRGMK
mmetsp:Transcript_7488/g.23548  ORF Transcript_7488/g.23548 Transcript_7488/m.23548 type:complete len:222 (-) Transcript_7488:1017-1682(-)